MASAQDSFLLCLGLCLLRQSPSQQAKAGLPCYHLSCSAASLLGSHPSLCPSLPGLVLLLLLLLSMSALFLNHVLVLCLEVSDIREPNIARLHQA